MDARAGLVHGIYRLIWEETIGYIAIGQFHCRFDRFVRIAYTVIVLVFLFDVLQDGQRFFCSRGGYRHLLEAAFECSVLFYVLTILIQRSGSDALYLSTGKSGFEHIGRIHRSGCRACSHDGMYLVDEEDDLRILLQLIEHGFQPLFELSAIFGAGYHLSQIEADDPLVEKNTAHLPVHDAFGQSFHDGTLAHTGFADEHRIVLFAPAEYLYHPFDLLLPTHYRVELACCCHGGDVGAEGVQCRRVASTPCRGGSIASAGILFGSVAGASACPAIPGRRRGFVLFVVEVVVLVPVEDLHFGGRLPFGGVALSEVIRQDGVVFYTLFHKYLLY